MSEFVWTGEIGDQLLNFLINTRDRPLILCSSGGDSVITLGVLDELAAHPRPIHAIGQCSSAAVDVVAAGKPGYRTASPHTRFMLHRCSTEISDSYAHSALREAKEVKYVNDKLVQLLAKHTKRPAPWWHHHIHLNEPWYMDAEEALSLGIIDEIRHG